jgi:hypothetical protein
MIQGQQLGKITLVNSLEFLWKVNQQMHAYAVVVDFLNESAEMLYQKYGLHHLYKKMIKAECFYLWFPHITAHKFQPCRPFWSKPVKEASKHPGRPVGADPEQPFSPGIQLIYQGDEFIPSSFAPAYFIGTDSGNTVQITVGKTPFHSHFNRAYHRIPTGHEGYRHFLPAHTLGPGGQKPGIGRGQAVLASGPRHFFHLDPVAERTIDPAWTVEEENQNSPKGNKLESSLGQSVVARSLSAAAGADGPAATSGTQGYFNGQMAVLPQFTSVIDKTRLFFDPVQDSLYMHPVSPCLGLFRGGNVSRQGKTGCFFCEEEVGCGSGTALLASPPVWN